MAQNEKKIHHRKTAGSARKGGTKRGKKKGTGACAFCGVGNARGKAGFENPNGKNRIATIATGVTHTKLLCFPHVLWIYSTEGDGFIVKITRLCVSLLVLPLLLVLCAPALAETTTDLALRQAQADAEVLLSIRRALWYDWLDQYNRYVADLMSGSAATEPEWTTSVVSLQSGGYLSGTLPPVTLTKIATADGLGAVDVTLGISGPSANVINNYLPLATVASDKTSVTWRVTAPAAYVAGEALLKGKLNRDGTAPSGETAILPGADVTFGAGSQLHWTDDDGKLLGVKEIRMVAGTVDGVSELTLDSGVISGLARLATSHGDVIASDVSGVTVKADKADLGDLTVTDALSVRGSATFGARPTMTSVTGAFATLNDSDMLAKADVAPVFADHDARITANADEIAAHDLRITANRNRLDVHETRLDGHDADIAENRRNIADHDARITAGTTVSQTGAGINMASGSTSGVTMVFGDDAMTVTGGSGGSGVTTEFNGDQAHVASGLVNYTSRNASDGGGKLVIGGDPATAADGVLLGRKKEDWNYLTVDGYKVWTEKDFTLEDLFGYVSVKITPDEVLPLGPKWEAWDEDSKVTTGWIDAGTPKRLAPGLYTVRFTDVTNWKTPDPVSVLVKRANREEVTVKYLAQPKLTVNIGPAGVPAGARWRLTSGPDTGWKQSGTQVQVPPGTYTVEFSDLAAEKWARPASVKLVFTWDDVIVKDVAYAKYGAIRTTITGHGSGRWAVGSSGWQTSGTTLSVPPGSQTVTFSAISGYNRPGNKAVTVPEGETVNVSGAYSKIPPPPPPAPIKLNTHTYIGKDRHPRDKGYYVINTKWYCTRSDGDTKTKQYAENVRADIYGQTVCDIVTVFYSAEYICFYSNLYDANGAAAGYLGLHLGSATGRYYFTHGGITAYGVPYSGNPPASFPGYYY